MHDPGRRPAPPLRRAGLSLALGALVAASLGACATPLRDFHAVPVTTALETSPATLPTRWGGGYVLAEASIDGRGPWTLVLDTGASVASIAPRVAEALHLERGTFGREDEGVAVGGAAGTQIRVRNAVRIDALRVGPLVVREIDALVLDLSGLERVSGIRIDGILPAAAFREVLLTLDGPAARVTVERGELPPPDGADVLALEGGALPHVTVDVGGAPCRVLLDSGSTEFVTVPAALAPALRFRAPPVETGRVGTIADAVAVRSGRIDGSLAWGRHRIQDPVVGLTPAENGSAGLRLLTEFRTTFDLGHDRVRFERSTDAPILSRPVRSPGAGFLRGEDAWTVAYVLDGGPAARAGLRVGDRVDRMEGLPIAQVGTMYEILVATSDTLRLRVTREGDAAREVAVPVETLVE